MSNKSGVADQILSLPRGGGDMRGLGETFTADLYTGTGAFTIPIALPKGRNGLVPSLALSYGSGQGNGPFGLGFAIGVPAIARKTSRGVPWYKDERDVFQLPGAGDLVAVDPLLGEYRPRTEKTFARILRHLGPRDDYWEVRSRDGLVASYGTPGLRGADPAVIADPADSGRSRVFAWRLTATVDPFGNRIDYTYVRDGAQLYLDEIRYVDFGPATDYLVRVRFTYSARPDRFSDRRAGFEIRTVQRCTRIEVTTGAPLRTYHLAYADQLQGADNELPANGVSLLRSVRVQGLDGEQSEELPPLGLGYGRFAPDRRRLIPIAGPDLPPLSLAHPELELADLFGTGLPDLVRISASDTCYWRNLGDGRFDRARTMNEAPAGVSLGSAGVQLVDADGDGRIDLMVTVPPLAGYFPLQLVGGWSARSFRAYEWAPSFDLTDPEVRLVDLDGDGVTDAIRSGSTMECYFHDRDKGWFAAVTSEAPPGVRFSDRRVQLADMTGDGLQDIVVIHDRRIDYWPSLGRGKWGARIFMRSSPELPEGYDPRRVLLGDVDGDGLADVVYVEDDSITVWINQAGNGFAPPLRILATPRVSDIDAVRLVDLLGTGVRGILWANGLDDSRAPMYFLDLTGGRKPYLLESIDGHLGSTTEVTYAPSTRFYVADQARPETRWKTTLPFPVQVVARVRLTDAFSGGWLTTEYTYHHGHWDGVEREFCGFGRVDHRDAERILLGDVPTSFAPPSETRTWFHLGPVGGHGESADVDLSREAWAGDAPVFSTAALPADLTLQARRDALRALRGSVLRTEVYVHDDSPLAARPYTVTEQLHAIRAEWRPPAGSTGLHVFFARPVASRTSQWERGREPMTDLQFTGDHDAYGQARFETRIAVPRGRDFRVAGPAGTPYLVTHTRTDHASLDDGARYIVDRIARTTTHEVKNDGSTAALDLARGLEPGPGPNPIIAQTVHYFDGPAFIGAPFGIIERFGALVRSETLAFTTATVSEIYSTVPPYLVDGPPAWTEEYPLELRDLLAPHAGHVFRSGPEQTPGWFIAVERNQYDFHRAVGGGRGLVTVQVDPVGRATAITYDEHELLPASVTDPAGLTTLVVYDQRVLGPRVATDPNGNRTSYRYSPLGLLFSIAVMGREGEIAGDTGDAPSVQFAYDFTAFAMRGEPILRRTVKRVWHASDTSPTSERDQTITSMEYFDGLGRRLQTRTQAADVAFGDPRSGRIDLDVPSIGRPAGAAPRVLVSGAQVYDNKGRVIERFEPGFDTGWGYAPLAQGEKDLLFYDPRGRLVRTRYPDDSEDRAIHGVPAELSTPELFEPTPWETYAYDRNDNAGRTHDPARSAGFRSHWDTPASTEIDALGRTIRAVQRNGASPSEWHTTVTDYDIRGNPVREIDPLGRVAFERTYDLANRISRTTALDGGTTVSVFDAAGALIERRDAKGALTLRAQDKAGRDIRLWARDAAGEAITLRERRTYGDGADSGLTRDDALTRNLLGRNHRSYDEAGIAAIMAYDFKGRVLERTRQVIADDQLLSIFTAPPPDWSMHPVRVNWAPPTGTTLADHELALLDSTAHDVSMTYDALDRVRTSRCPADVTGGRKELRSHYDRAGMLEAIDLDGAKFIERIVYNAKGLPTLTVRGNGVMTRREHDPKTWRLARLQTVSFASGVPLTYAAARAPLQDLRYGYDLVGNVLSVQDRAPGSGVPQKPDELERVFSYDPIYRLVAATGREAAIPLDEVWSALPRSNDVTQTRLYVQQYRYDDAGNLTQLAHESAGGTFARALAVVPGTNRLSTMTIGLKGHTYTYDACGNLTAETTSRRFAWDHGNRMRAFVTQAGTSEPSVYTQYLYDGAGLRVMKLTRKQGGVYEATIYVDGVFERRRIVHGGSKVENDEIHVGAGSTRAAIVRVGPALPGDSSPAVAYQVSDHIGSSCVTLDGLGGFVKREEYTPYGETSFGSFARKRYRFTGKERDEESGLGYHAARYYAPWLGRWTSCDPAGAVDGLNLFAYVRSNPLRLSDPSGRAGEPAGAEVPVQLRTGKAAEAQFSASLVENKVEFVAQRSMRDASGARITTKGAGGILDYGFPLGTDKLEVVDLTTTRQLSNSQKMAQVDKYLGGVFRWIGAELRRAVSSRATDQIPFLWKDITGGAAEVGSSVGRLQGEFHAYSLTNPANASKVGARTMERGLLDLGAIANVLPAMARAMARLVPVPGAWNEAALTFGAASGGPLTKGALTTFTFVGALAAGILDLRMAVIADGLQNDANERWKAGRTQHLFGEMVRHLDAQFPSRMGL